MEYKPELIRCPGFLISDEDPHFNEDRFLKIPG